MWIYESNLFVLWVLMKIWWIKTVMDATLIQKSMAPSPIRQPCLIVKKSLQKEFWLLGFKPMTCTTEQGSFGSWKSCKVIEFYSSIFQDQILENDMRSLEIYPGNLLTQVIEFYWKAFKSYQMVRSNGWKVLKCILFLNPGNKTFGGLEICFWKRVPTLLGQECIYYWQRYCTCNNLRSFYFIILE